MCFCVSVCAPVRMYVHVHTYTCTMDIYAIHVPAPLPPPLLPHRVVHTHPSTCVQWQVLVLHAASAVRHLLWRVETPPCTTTCGVQILHNTIVRDIPGSMKLSKAHDIACEAACVCGTRAR